MRRLPIPTGPGVTALCVNGKGGSGVDGNSVLNFLYGGNKLGSSRVKGVSIGSHCTCTTVTQPGLEDILGGMGNRGVGNMGAVMRRIQ